MTDPNLDQPVCGHHSALGDCFLPKGHSGWHWHTYWQFSNPRLDKRWADEKRTQG